MIPTHNRKANRDTYYFEVVGMIVAQVEHRHRKESCESADSRTATSNAHTRANAPRVQSRAIRRAT